MRHITVALVVFAFVFCSAAIGLYLRTLLPKHHLDADSIGVIKLVTGLIATMAALVLGLLISSAKSSLDVLNSEVVRDAANIILLDRMLAQYGPETHELRGLLKQAVGAGVNQLASGDPAQLEKLHGPDGLRRAEALERKLAELSPKNDMQRRLQDRAVAVIDDALAVRELGLLQATGTLPTTLLVILVFWLCIIFGAFGLYTPTNLTVIMALFLGALSTSVAIFLILEMSTPLDGLIRVSFSPMKEALAILGQ